MSYDDTAIGGPAGQFPSTQVSLLEAVSGGMAGEALEKVVALYWKPVYRFLRVKFGKDNEDAKDLTQSFFATALERDLFGRFDPAKASFRGYLRMAVERFAANQHAAAQAAKRGGDLRFVPVDEVDLAAIPAEEVFEREWRRQVFALAIDDLRTLAEREGKQLKFGIFEEYDLTAGERPTYAELAARHGIAETSVTNHLAWARRMLRGLVTERLRGVTPGERELREEMRRIWN
jgi:RNA polymerase sigma factor (sigma-70 family)